VQQRVKKLNSFILILLSPWIIGFFLLFLTPLIWSAYYSFTKFSILDPPKWIGLENYRYAFMDDPYFWPALKNTLWVMLTTTPLRIIIALVITFYLQNMRRFQKSLLVIISLPVILPSVATLLGFKKLFNPNNGLINLILQKLGIDNPPLWFVTPNGSKWGYVLVMLWGVGDAVLLYLAGVTRIQVNILDAARMDNISIKTQFIFIVLPLLSPLILFSAILGTVTATQNFTSSVILNSSLDNQSSLYFLSTHLYVEGYKYFYMGYASALGWIMAISTLLVITLIIWTGRFWVKRLV